MAFAPDEWRGTSGGNKKDPLDHQSNLPVKDMAGASSISASIEVTSAAMNLDRGTKPRLRGSVLPRFLPRLRSLPPW